MVISDWPSNERPREKLLAQGPQQLSDAELLAIFLRTGIRGYTAVDLARALLSQHGNLRAVCDLTIEQFCHQPGVGITKYVQLQAALEIGHRYLEQTVQRSDVMKSTNITQRYLVARLRHFSYEVFAGLFLDSQHRVICFKELFHGTLDQAAIYPREIVKYALQYNAAAIILAHNHPSGIAKPSQADQEVTRQIQAALALVGTRVLDHVIVGEGSQYSFAEAGLL